MPTHKILTWKITNEMVNKWKCLDPDISKNIATDCTINSLQFFDVIDRKEAEKLSKEMNNIKKTGTYPNETLSFIFNKFNNEMKEIHEISESHNFKNNNWKEYLIKLIKPGYASIFLIYGHNHGHALIVGVTDDKQLVLIDPQQEIFFVTNESIDEYLTKYEFIKFRLIYKNLKESNKRNLNPTKIQIRKQKIEEPKRKKRKITHRLSSSAKTKTKTMKYNSNKSTRSGNRLQSYSSRLSNLPSYKSSSNKSLSNKSLSNKSLSNKSLSYKSSSNRSLSNRSLSNRSLSNDPFLISRNPRKRKSIKETNVQIRKMSSDQQITKKSRF